jgi:hypothetical protein
MRYTAENLRGCLVETMARFRPNIKAEALLAAVEFVAPEDDPELPAVRAVNDWLAEQRVGLVTVVTPQPLLVDIEAAELLVDLDAHPLVREAVDNSPLSDGDFPVHLDAGLIRLGGDVGRPITQAVSRAVHEQHPEVDGIAYWSRIDSSERCWAIYGHVPVDVAITDLSADDPHHRTAVQNVAALLKVPLPPAWR